MIFTSAARSTDAEASSDEFSEIERAVFIELIEVVISSIGDRTTGASAGAGEADFFLETGVV